MKTIDELGISKTPWYVQEYSYSTNGPAVECALVFDENGEQRYIFSYDLTSITNASLIASAPDLYEALFDCCEEVNGNDAPRCYGCRRGEDGRCMARGVCNVYKALAKASGEDVER